MKARLYLRVSELPQDIRVELKTNVSRQRLFKIRGFSFWPTKNRDIVMIELCVNQRGGVKKFLETRRLKLHQLEVFRIVPKDKIMFDIKDGSFKRDSVKISVKSYRRGQFGNRTGKDEYHIKVRGQNIDEVFESRKLLATDKHFIS